MEEHREQSIGIKEETTIMPGEAYVQYILNQLNGIEVKGADNMNRLLNSIRMLERLRDDIISHKAQPEVTTETEEGGVTDGN